MPTTVRKENPSQLISRQTILSEVRLLLSKPVFSHEDSARCSQLLSLAGHLAPEGNTSNGSAEMRSFERGIRNLRVGSMSI